MTEPEGPACHDLEDCRLSATHVQTLLGREADQIARHFRGLFFTETIEALVEDSYTQLAAHARIHTHLP
ncbi:MAG: arsenate reductase ArsC, partial [Pseudonocardia sp.]|nr:arsenate reductase ArsC [Pseudonocardia sp.]